MRSLKTVDPGDIIRVIRTRMPVVMPSRVTADLARMLGASAPSGSWYTRITRAKSRMSFDAGSLSSWPPGPRLNQSVLLRGINDDASVLEELFRGLVRSGVKPYYLFQEISPREPRISEFPLNAAWS